MTDMRATERPTATDFESAYASRSGVTVDALRRLGRVVAECSCGEDGCDGFQSISADRARWDGIEIVWPK